MFHHPSLFPLSFAFSASLIPSWLKHMTVWELFERAESLCCLWCGCCPEWAVVTSSGGIEMHLYTHKNTPNVLKMHYRGVPDHSGQKESLHPEQCSMSSSAGIAVSEQIQMYTPTMCVKWLCVCLCSIYLLRSIYIYKVYISVIIL